MVTDYIFYETIIYNEGTLAILEILVMKQEVQRFQGLAILRPYLLDGLALYVGLLHQRLEGVGSPLGWPPRTRKWFLVVRAQAESSCLRRIPDTILKILFVRVPFLLLYRRPLLCPFCCRLSRSTGA